MATPKIRASQTIGTDDSNLGNGDPRQELNEFRKFLIFFIGVFLFLAVVFVGAAEAYPYIVWMEKAYGGSGLNQAYGIAVDSNDSAIVTGRWSTDGAGEDYITIKYDSNGNLLWSRTYDGGSLDWPFGVAVDSNNNIIVTGYSTLGGDKDYFTIKYDSNGNQLWNKTFDSGYTDVAYGVAVDSNNSIIVTGCSYNGATNDYFTIKYDSNGNHLWNRTYDGGDDDCAEGIAVDSNGNVIVTGHSNISGTNDYLTIKYDSNGNPLWNRTYDGGGGDRAERVAVDSKDSIIVTGFSNLSGTYDYLTIKYDSNGNLLWSRTYDGGDSDIARGVAVDSKDNVIVTGRSTLGSKDYFTIKYDSNGNLLWNISYDDGGNEAATDVAIDSYNNVIVTGGSYNGTNYAFLTIKYAEDAAPPTWQSVGANNTNPSVGEVVLFYSLWHDDSALDKFIFSWNASGACDTWANESALNFSDGWANVTKAIPSVCDGKSIGFRFYANDSAGNWNATPIQVITTTVDTQPPTITVHSPVDGFNTSIALQAFNFTASDNLASSMTCSLSVDGSYVNSTAASNGTPAVITYDFASDGSYAWNITCWDDASNPGASATRTINVDTQPPTVALNPGSPGENLNTSIALQAFNFTASDNLASSMTCSLSVDGSYVNSTAASNGTPAVITYDFASDGSYAWNITCWDDASNPGASATRTINVDTQAPSVSIVSPQNVSYNTADLVVNVSALDATGVDTVVAEINGSVNVTLTSHGGYYNASYTFSEGANSVRVYANDSAGNLNSGEVVVFTVDTQAPSVTLSSPANNSWTSDSTPGFTFTVVDSLDDVLSCELFVDGVAHGVDSSVSNGSAATITANASLSDGLHTWSVVCMDSASNMGGSPQWALNVDTAPPSVTIHSPQNITYDKSYVALAFSAIDANGVSWTGYSLDGAASVTSGNTTLSGLSNGTHYVEVYANDTAGNMASNGTHFSIDIAAGSVEAVVNMTDVGGVYLGYVDAIGQVGVEMEIAAVQELSGSVNITSYHAAPAVELDPSTGLGPDEEAARKYVRIDVSDNLNAASGNLAWVVLRVYYTGEDLPPGLVVNTLRLYWYNESGGNWIKLRKGLDLTSSGGPYVYDAGVNASAGHVWANLSHLSIYGIGGRVARQAGYPMAGGAASHGIAILEVVAPEEVALGGNATLRVRLRSDSTEPGVKIVLELPWGKKEVSTTVPAGTGEHNVSFTVPWDASPGVYRVKVEVNAWFGGDSRHVMLKVRETPPIETPSVTAAPEVTPAPTAPAKTMAPTPTPTGPAPTSAPAPGEKGFCGPTVIALLALLAALAVRRLIGDS
jgi:uncharacterized delta-60 repeat protein